MMITREQKFGPLRVTQVQILVLVAYFLFLLFTSPEIVFALPKVFSHNILEFIWNAFLIFLTIRAVLLVWVRPVFRIIIADTSKIGQQLEWYDQSFKQLTPETKRLSLQRNGFIFTLALSSMLIPYLPYPAAQKWFPAFSSLISVDPYTLLAKDFFSMFTRFESFAIFSIMLWLLLVMEGRSRILARILARKERQKEKSAFLNPLPPNPFDPTSDKMAISIFTVLDEQGIEAWHKFEEKALRGSFMFFAPVGAGKTTGLIIPILEQMIAWQHDCQDKKASLIVYDPKAELTNVVVDFASLIGRKKDLLVLSLDDPSKTINPIFVPDPWEGNAASKIAGWIVAAWINYQGKSSLDPYWENQTYLLLSHLVVVLFVEKGNSLTIYDVYKNYLSLGNGMTSKGGALNDFGFRILSNFYSIEGNKVFEKLSNFTLEKPQKQYLTEKVLAVKQTIIDEIAFDFQKERIDFHLENTDSIKDYLQDFDNIDDPILKETYQEEMQDCLLNLVKKDLEKGLDIDEAEIETKAVIRSLGEEAKEKLIKEYSPTNDMESVYHIMQESLDWFLKSWQKFCRNDNADSILTNIQPFLREFSSPELIKILSPKQQTVNFSSLVTEGSIIVPSFPGIKIGDKLANAIITLIKSSWQNAVLENSDTKRMKIQIMDEAQRILNISSNGNSGDLEYIEMSRSFGGSTVIASQSVAAIEVKASKDAGFQKIHGVVRSLGCFGTNDFKTIQFMQQIAGKETVERKSKTVTENKAGPKMDAISEEYGSDSSSLSLSYTLSETLEDRIQAKDISEADPFTAKGMLFDGQKNSIHKICFKPYFWPDRRDSHTLMMKCKFDTGNRKKFKRRRKKDPIKNLFKRKIS